MRFLLFFVVAVSALAQGQSTRFTIIPTTNSSGTPTAQGKLIFQDLTNPATAAPGTIAIESPGTVTTDFVIKLFNAPGSAGCVMASTLSSLVSTLSVDPTCSGSGSSLWSLDVNNDVYLSNSAYTLKSLTFEDQTPSTGSTTVTITSGAGQGSNVLLDVAGVANNAAVSVSAGWVQSYGGFLSLADTWNAINSPTDGAWLRGLTLQNNTAVTNGGYLDLAPIAYWPGDVTGPVHDKYGNPSREPIPLPGLSSFGTNDMLMWVGESPLNASGGPVVPIQTVYGLNINQYIFDLVGFASNYNSANSFDADPGFDGSGGGMHAVSLTAENYTNGGHYAGNPPATTNGGINQGTFYWDDTASCEEIYNSSAYFCVPAGGSGAIQYHNTSGPGALAGSSNFTYVSGQVTLTGTGGSFETVGTSNGFDASTCTAFNCLQAPTGGVEGLEGTFGGVHGNAPQTVTIIGTSGSGASQFASLVFTSSGGSPLWFMATDPGGTGSTDMGIGVWGGSSLSITGDYTTGHVGIGTAALTGTAQTLAIGGTIGDSALTVENGFITAQGGVDVTVSTAANSIQSINGGFSAYNTAGGAVSGCAYAISTNCVVDSSRNVTTANLDVTGTCTGCSGTNYWQLSGALLEPTSSSYSITSTVTGSTIAFEISNSNFSVNGNGLIQLQGTSTAGLDVINTAFNSIQTTGNIDACSAGGCASGYAIAVDGTAIITYSGGVITESINGSGTFSELIGTATGTSFTFENSNTNFEVNGNGTIVLQGTSSAGLDVLNTAFNSIQTTGNIDACTANTCSGGNAIAVDGTTVIDNLRTFFPTGIIDSGGIQATTGLYSGVVTAQAGIISEAAVGATAYNIVNGSGGFLNGGVSCTGISASTFVSVNGIVTHC